MRSRFSTAMGMWKSAKWLDIQGLARYFWIQGSMGKL
jgi:hypothetical protein